MPHTLRRAFALALADAFADPLGIETALCRQLFAHAMNLADDVVRVHGADDGRSSSGLQITGHANPASAQMRSMRRMMLTLLMCVQFQVSRKSMPCTADTAT